MTRINQMEQFGLQGTTCVQLRVVRGKERRYM